MTSRTLNLIWAALLGFSVGFSGETLARAQTPPVRPALISRTKMAYKVFAWMAFDVDKALKESQIEIQSCTYQSDMSRASVSYKGIGPCLFLSFKESMRTTALSGYIFAWGKTPWGELQGMRLEWRPVRGGWKDAIHSWVDIQFESYFRWTESDRLLSQESLLGELKLFFPAEYPVQKLALSSRPVRRKDGLVEFEGSIQISAQKKHLENTSLSYESNLNIVNTKRTFFFRAHSKQELGVMP